MLQEYIELAVQNLSESPLSQIAGFIGMFTIITALLQKDDNTTKKLMLFAMFFWGIHFYLLGIATGLVSIFIGASRLLFSIKYEKNMYGFWFFILLACGMGVYTYSGLLSILPLIASASGTYAYFFLAGVRLRFQLMFGSMLWLVYHISIGSVSGVLNEIFALSAMTLTIYHMLHPEGGMHYYGQKIKDILWKRNRPDYDRFIFVQDKFISFRLTTGFHFHRLLHLDLLRSIRKRKSMLCSKFLKQLKGQ